MANYALSFDGIDDYVKVNYADSINVTKQLSIGMWIKQHPGGDVNYNGCSKLNQYYLSGFRSSSYGAYFYIHTSDGDKFCVSQVKDSNFIYEKWHFIVGTYDNVNMKIYVDGILEKTRYVNLDIIPNSNYLILGAYTADSEFSKSDIDNVHIYSRALSADEIQALYFGKEVDSTGLVGWWKFDEGSGTTAIDSSGNGNNGTLMGGPTYTEFPTRIVGAGSLQI